MNINRNFIITLTPKDREQYGGRRRFSVGAASLHKYVGQKAADSCFTRIMKSKKMKRIFSFTHFGTVTFYQKIE